MQPCIRRWHTRYRVVGGGNAVARLESDVRTRVAEHYAAAVEQIFGNDPAVYVLRRLHVELTIANPSLADEALLARRWAERACTAAAKTVMRRGDDASEVMRFDDTAEFVARFLADLVDDAAWDRWYYSPFVRYRILGEAEAVRSILFEHRDLLPAIFERLARLRREAVVLSRLSPAAARELWRNAIRRLPDAPRADDFRVFVRAAMEIADALEFWRGARPEEDELLARFVASAPEVPDWTSTRALAAAVLAVLTFAVRRGIARATTILDDEQWQRGVASLEWLDRDWLREAIAAGLAESPSSQPPHARTAVLTALQRRVLAVVRQLLADGRLVLSDDDADSDRNALAIFAALAGAEPSLAAHGSAAASIAWALEASKRVEPPALPAAQRLARAIDASLGTITSSTAYLDAERIESRFVGLFLLSRAVLEARLPQLAAALGAGPIAALLHALAVEWTGAVDDGVLAWSGCTLEPTELLDPLRCQALREAVERLLRDRAVFAPSLLPAVDPGVPPVRAIASHLMRLWAHWLPGLAQSSDAWLLQQLIVRRGVVCIAANRITVSLQPAPLDPVLEMAGYLAPIAEVPWLEDRRVVFEIDRSMG